MHDNHERRSITYDPYQLRETADFITKNNTYLNRAVTIDEIMGEVRKHCFKPSINYVGTAGWYCVIQGNDTHVTLDFFVDLRVSKESCYVIAEVP